MQGMRPVSAVRVKAYLVWGAAASAATFLFYCWLLRPIIHGYFPTGDELAIEVTSTPIGGEVSPAIWFTQGFHFYFVTYPEWQIANTDFWRPLANGLFWLYYQLFGTHWSDQLIVGYLTHAVVVLVTGYVACCEFRLNRWLTAMAMLIAGVSPAVWAQCETQTEFAYNTAPGLVQYPVFQIDILCGLLMLCACIAFIHRRMLLLCALTTAALLLKETALTVPIAAMVLVGSWWRADAARAARNFLWILLPLVLWCTARLATFHYGTAVYVLATSTPWRSLLKPIRNLLYLPTFLYRGPLRTTAEALHSRDLGVLAQHGSELAVNAAWWGALLYALGRHYQHTGKHWLQTLAEPRVCGLIFALGNLALVMVLQAPDPRFAYFWFTLGPAAIFASIADRRHGITVATLITLGLVVPQFWSMSRTLSPSAMQGYRLSKHAAAQLVPLLGQLPSSVRNVYLLDDIVLHGTSPQYLARFAGFPGQLTIINSIEPRLGCQADPPRFPRYALQHGTAGTVIQYQAPACFYQLSAAPLTLIREQQVQRGGWMTYRFPELTVEPGSNGAQYDPGEHWSAVVNEPACSAPGACIWLGLDLTHQLYFVLQ